MSASSCKKRLFKFNYLTITATIAATLVIMPSFSQQSSSLTVGQIMNAIIAPMTSTIWGAYDIKTDAQWQELENAAYTVIAAADLLKSVGTNAVNEDWQQESDNMIAASRAVLAAIGNKDEEALFNAGNDQLYPPCESCHQKYMAQ